MRPEEEYLGLLDQTRKRRPEEELLPQRPEEEYLNSQLGQARAAPAYRSTYDVTIGAALHGTADLVENVGEGLPFGADKLSAIQAMSATMKRFKAEHPEYSPVEVNSAMDLVTNPAAMSSRLFNGAPQMAAQIGLMSIPYAGLPLAAGMTMAAEANRGYEEARSRGATEDDAVLAGRAQAVAATAIQLLTDQRIVNFAKGEQGWFVRQLAQRGVKLTKAGTLAADAAGEATTAALLGMLQGATNEGIANWAYGKKIDPGFIDRRLQDAIGGGIAGLVFGGGLKGLRALHVKPDGVQVETPLDVSDRDTLFRYLVDNKGMEPNHAAPMSEVVDAFARQWSSRTGQAPEKWYSTFVTPEIADGQSTGAHIATNTQGVPKMFFTKDPVESIRNFFDIVQNDIPDADKKMFQEMGIDNKQKMTDTFVRYLQEGYAPAPELVEPFKAFKQTLKDVYLTTKEVAWDKMPSKLRAAMDRTLSVDDDQIAEARRKLYTSEEELLKVRQAEQDQRPQRTSKDTALIKAGPDINRMLDDALDQQIRLVDARELHPEGSPERARIQQQLDQLQSEIDRLGGESLRSLKTDLYTSQKPPTVKPSQDIPLLDPNTGRVRFEHVKGDFERAHDTVRDMYDDLQRLQLGRLMPDRDSAVARRSSENGTIRENFRNETPEQRVQRNGFQKAVSDPLSQWLDYSAPLRHFKWGRKLLDAVGNVVATRNLIAGKFDEENVRTFLDLSHRDREWLSQVDEAEAARTGLRLDNFTRFIEAVGVPNPIVKPPSEPLRAYRDQVKRVMVELGNMAEREGMTVQLPDGTISPYRQPKELRMLRFLTDDARMAITRREGAVYDAIKTAIEKADPESRLGGLQSALADYAQGTGIRESGPLTDARTIKYFPTEVMVNGQRIKLLHTEPFGYLRKAVRAQAYQIGWHQVMGDAKLEKAETSVMKKMVEQLGLAEPYNLDVLKARFKEKGFEVPAHADDMKMLEKIAKQSDIETGPKRKDYVRMLQSLTVNDITPEKESTLRSLAGDLGGIDTSADVPRLVDEVKRRALEKPFNVVDVLTNNLVAEGGDRQLATNVIRLSQGIPINKVGGEFLERNPIIRGLNLASGLIGSAQTSSSVVPNIPQTLVQVPQMAGIRNFLGAIESVLGKKQVEDFKGNYNNIKSTLIALGAIVDTHQAWGMERGYRIEGIGRNIRQAVQLGTGMKYIADLNNVIAGESFRRLAMDWKTSPERFNANDAQLARRLELTDAQVSAIKAGKMDELTFAKIVQQGVAKTQFVTESAHNRGILETHPILKMIFAYNAYASGTARATADVLRSMSAGLKSGDPATMIRAGARLATYVGGAMGAGIMAEGLRQVVRGDSSRVKDESVWDKAFGAALSVQLVGPAQRMLENMRYDKGEISNWVTGLMPQLRAVWDAVAVAYNIADQASGGEGKYGRFAEFSPGRQVKELALQHAPLAKAFRNWVDLTAYPDKVMYDEARVASGKWQADVLGKKGSDRGDPLNPDYYPIWEWASRNDTQAAMKAAGEYYQNYYRKMAKDPEQAVMEGLGADRARLGLRASLQKRAPLNMGVDKMGFFLAGLPQEKREKYIQAHAKYMAIVDSVAPSND